MTVKNRKDIGKVEFPIEKLMALRAGGYYCIHIEAVFESESKIANPTEEPRDLTATEKIRRDSLSRPGLSSAAAKFLKSLRS